MAIALIPDGESRASVHSKLISIINFIQGNQQAPTYLKYTRDYTLRVDSDVTTPAVNTRAMRIIQSIKVPAAEGVRLSFLPRPVQRIGCDPHRRHRVHGRANQHHRSQHCL